MARLHGAPVKGVAIRAGDCVSRGEWVITPDGIEGGGVYAVAAPIRDGQAAHVDLAPDLGGEELARRFAQMPAKLSVGSDLTGVFFGGRGTDNRRCPVFNRLAQPFADNYAERRIGIAEAGRVFDE